MATTLRDFIAQRETEIRDQQKALKAELRDLQVAKAALDGVSQPAATGAATPTIKDMVRLILGDQPGGLNSSGILDAIKKTFGRDIERTSLSPQLSRLKDDGELFLLDDTWLTAQHHEAHQRRLWGEAGEALSNYAATMPEQSPPRGGFGDPFEDDETPF